MFCLFVFVFYPALAKYLSIKKKLGHVFVNTYKQDYDYGSCYFYSLFSDFFSFLSLTSIGEHLSIYLSICLSVYLSVCLSVCLCIYIYIYIYKHAIFKKKHLWLIYLQGYFTLWLQCSSWINEWIKSFSSEYSLSLKKVKS